MAQECRNRNKETTVRRARAEEETALMNSLVNKMSSASVEAASVLLEVSVASTEWEEAWVVACMISSEADSEALVGEWEEDSLPCRHSPQAWATPLVLHQLNLKPSLRTENESLELKRRQLIKLVTRRQLSLRRQMRETAADRSKLTNSQIMQALSSKNQLTSNLDISESQPLQSNNDGRLYYDKSAIPQSSRISIVYISD